MTNQDVLNNLIQIYNILTEISVKGEDAIRMAQVLQSLNQLGQQINQNIQTEINKVQKKD